MLRAYSALKQVLAEQGLTVLDLARRIRRRGQRVNLKSLYRLNNDRQPLERLDLRVAGVICQVCQVPLSELITFEKPRARLLRLPAGKQQRLDVLMAKNNDGRLTRAEQGELQDLVREAEQITLENARMLAGQRRELAGQ
jgi:Cro/C1-type HTH DNA-binding domain